MKRVIIAIAAAWALVLPVEAQEGQPPSLLVDAYECMAETRALVVPGESGRPALRFF